MEAFSPRNVNRKVVEVQVSHYPGASGRSGETQRQIRGVDRLSGPFRFSSWKMVSVQNAKVHLWPNIYIRHSTEATETLQLSGFAVQKNNHNNGHVNKQVRVF